MALQGAQGTVSIIDKATAPLRNIAKAFKDLGNSSSKTNQNLSGTQKAINGLTAAQNRLGRVQSIINKQTSNIGGQAIGVAALAMSFKQALQPAIKFEQSMKDLEAVAFGTADSTVPVAENMKLLSDQAKKLGSETMYTAVQAAEGQLFLAKAGFKTNDILAAMRPLLDLASASGTDLGRASDITSDLLGAFGMKAQETGKLADVLAAATSSANVDMETLFETLKVSAPIGVAAGQSMEGIVTATSLLGNVGIKGSMAGTALKNALTNLASPAANGAKVLKDLGIKVADSAGNMLPLQDIMLKLGKASKGLSQVKRIEAFDAVFGKIAMAGALNLEEAVNSGDFEKLLKNLEDSEGVADKMAKIRMDSTEGSMIALMSAVEGLSIAFGSILLPILRKVTEAFIKITGPIKSLIEENEGIVKGIGYVVAGLLVAKIGALAYTVGLWAVSSALTGLKVVLGIAKIAMIGFNLVMAANPIALTIIAISALVGIGIALYKNWDTITDTFKNLWETIKSFSLDLFNAQLERLSKWGDIISNVWTTVTDTFKNLWETIKIFDFSSITDGLAKVGQYIGLDKLFGSGGDTEITKNLNVAPNDAMKQVQSINQNNNQANITVNIEGDKVKSVNNEGDFKSNIFLNNGVQQ